MGKILPVGSMYFFEDGTFLVNDELCVQPGNIIQFTGWADKDGKDIYVGDIVAYPNDKCRGDVRFGKYESGDYDTYVCGTGFYINREDGRADPITKHNVPRLTIIGNIYDSNLAIESTKP